MQPVFIPRLYISIHPAGFETCRAFYIISSLRPVLFPSAYLYRIIMYVIPTVIIKQSNLFYNRTVVHAAARKTDRQSETKSQSDYTNCAIGIRYKEESEGLSWGFSEG
jgi:hypothetical protein